MGHPGSEKEKSSNLANRENLFSKTPEPGLKFNERSGGRNWTLLFSQ